MSAADPKTRNAEAIAADLKMVATIAAAWAAGEFRETPAAELWDRGWDCDQPTALAWEAPMIDACHNAEADRIEFFDEAGRGRAIDLTTGELIRI